MAVEGLKNKSPSEIPSEVQSLERMSVLRHLPADWIDRLLAAYTELPPAAPLEDALERLLVESVAILDDTAFAVSFPDVPRPRLIVQRPDRLSQPSSLVGAELFAEYEFSMVIPIPAEDGIALHVGANDRERFFDGGAGRLFVDRLAQVLSSVFRSRRLAEAQARELARLHDQVVQLERLASMGQLVASIVHELNNPLTSIVALADYLRKKAARGEIEPSDLERLERINEAAERLQRFSRDLIDYSSPRRMEPEPVAIDEVIDRALGFCEHELDKTGVMVERDFGVVPPVRGMAGQLAQVFVNLFTNAAHAMAETGGQLVISTSVTADRWVLVTVADDGHGIDEDMLPQIFDPFFTTKTDGTGTGLGLSIVRDIIANHGGKISARCNTPGGTVFQLELPSEESALTSL